MISAFTKAFEEIRGGFSNGVSWRIFTVNKPQPANNRLVDAILNYIN